MPSKIPINQQDSLPLLTITEAAGAAGGQVFLTQNTVTRFFNAATTGIEVVNRVAGTGGSFLGPTSLLDVTACNHFTLLLTELIQDAAADQAFASVTVFAVHDVAASSTTPDLLTLPAAQRALLPELVNFGAWPVGPGSYPYVQTGAASWSNSQVGSVSGPPGAIVGTVRFWLFFPSAVLPPTQAWSLEIWASQ